MDVSIAATVIFAAAAVLAAMAICRLITGSAAGGFIVMLPLALSIPWTKKYPAVADAEFTCAAFGVLWFWLQARRRPGKSRRTLWWTAATVALRPEVVTLAIAAVLAESWRRRKTLSARHAIVALGVVLAAVAASAVARNPAPVTLVLSSLADRVLNSSFFDGRNWMLVGVEKRNDLLVRSITLYGSTYFRPLVVPFLALGLRYRREWWFGPVCLWFAIVSVSTWQAVTPLVMRGCPVLGGAMLVFFGCPAALYLASTAPWLRWLARPAGAAEAQSPIAS